MKNRTRNFKLSLVARDVTIGGYKSGNLRGKCQFFAEPVAGTYEMGKMIAGLCLMTSVCLLLHQVLCTPTPTNVDGAHRQHRPLVRFLPRTTNQYGRIKSDFSDFIVDDDDLFELAKRQISDDYGHLRFGKREEQFDDYGHMRFGRSSASE